MLLREFLEKILKSPPPEGTPVEAAASYIYEHHFIRRTEPSDKEKTDPKAQNAFLKELEGANVFLSQWIALSPQRIDKDEFHTTYDGLNIRASEKDWRQVKGRYEIKLPTFCRGDDHWYRFFSGEFHHERSKPLARLYFNVTPQGAVFLLKWMSQLASKHPVRFGLKTATSLNYYRLRNDCGIFYYRQADENVFSPLIERLAVQLAGRAKWLRPETMPLTRELCPGISYGEDPQDGSASFGMHRSQLIADGLARCRNLGSLEECFTIVSQLWKEKGLLPDQPWETPVSEKQESLS